MSTSPLIRLPRQCMPLVCWDHMHTLTGRWNCCSKYALIWAVLLGLRQPSCCTYLNTSSDHAAMRIGSTNHSLHQDHGMQIAAREVEQSSPAGTIRLLYYAANASHYSPALEVLATSRRLLDDLPIMQPRRVCQLLWALAVLDLKPHAVLDRLEATMAATGESLWPCILTQQEGDMASKICAIAQAGFSQTC